MTDQTIISTLLALAALAALQASKKTAAASKDKRR
jgi:hypothetical protein